MLCLKAWQFPWIFFHHASGPGTVRRWPKLASRRERPARGSLTSTSISVGSHAVRPVVPRYRGLVGCVQTLHSFFQMVTWRPYQSLKENNLVMAPKRKPEDLWTTVSVFITSCDIAFSALTYRRICVTCFVFGVPCV